MKKVHLFVFENHNNSLPSVDLPSLLRIQGDFQAIGLIEGYSWLIKKNLCRWKLLDMLADSF